MILLSILTTLLIFNLGVKGLGFKKVSPAWVPKPPVALHSFEVDVCWKCLSQVRSDKEVEHFPVSQKLQLHTALHEVWLIVTGTSFSKLYWLKKLHLKSCGFLVGDRERRLCLAAFVPWAPLHVVWGSHKAPFDTYSRSSIQQGGSSWPVGLRVNKWEASYWWSAARQFHIRSRLLFGHTSLSLLGTVPQTRRPATRRSDGVPLADDLSSLCFRVKLRLPDRLHSMMGYPFSDFIWSKFTAGCPCEFVFHMVGRCCIPLLAESFFLIEQSI